jgi:hypothetical protein
MNEMSPESHAPARTACAQGSLVERLQAYQQLQQLAGQSQAPNNLHVLMKSKTCTHLIIQLLLPYGLITADDWLQLDYTEWNLLAFQQPALLLQAPRGAPLSAHALCTILQDHPLLAPELFPQLRPTSAQWCALLAKQPQLLSYLERPADLTADQWGVFLYRQPQLYESCPVREQLSEQAWAWLLESRPQLAPQMPYWSTLSPDYWVGLLQRQPGLATYVANWDDLAQRLTLGDWFALADKQPQLVLDKLGPRARNSDHQRCLQYAQGLLAGLVADNGSAAQGDLQDVQTD